MDALAPRIEHSGVRNNVLILEAEARNFKLPSPVYRCVMQRHRLKRAIGAKDYESLLGATLRTHPDKERSNQ